MPANKLFEVLSTVSQVIPAELDIDRLVQLIVNQGVGLVKADSGAFFYHLTSDTNPDEMLRLVAVSGTDLARFSIERSLPTSSLLTAHMNTPTRAMRVDDISQHPAFKGYPEGHPMLRSYLAVGVNSRFGNRGSLYFGHEEAGVFGEDEEEVAIALGTIAAVAMENALLFKQTQSEIDERNKVEKRLLSLMEELNHRVKNNLATVQSIALQTKKSILARGETPDLDTFCQTFESRLHSLSRSHDLLTQSLWVGVDFREALLSAIKPLVVSMQNVDIDGPSLTLGPNAAVTMALVFHELTRNAVQHGALGSDQGKLKVGWRVEDGLIHFWWHETDGPAVSYPTCAGFGSRLIEKGAMLELGGSAKLHYDAEGLRCEMQIPISSKVLISSVR